jgi:hypothetical protein
MWDNELGLAAFRMGPRRPVGAVDKIARSPWSECHHTRKTGI